MKVNGTAVVLNMYIEATRTEIKEDCKEFKAFPNPKDVFISDFEKGVLLPVGMVNLTIRDEEHSVLVAAPLCDENGYICRTNSGSRAGKFWISYSLQGGKWKLDCTKDELFSFEFTKNEVFESYSKKKDFFTRHGFLQAQEDCEPNDKFKSTLFEYGGLPLRESNWYYQIACDHLPHLLEDIDEDEEIDEFDIFAEREQYVVLFDFTGRQFIYIGSFGSWSYSRGLSSTNNMFYCPSTSRVLIITDYT